MRRLFATHADPSSSSKCRSLLFLHRCESVVADSIFICSHTPWGPRRPFVERSVFPRLVKGLTEQLPFYRDGTGVTRLTPHRRLSARCWRQRRVMSFIKLAVVKTKPVKLKSEAWEFWEEINYNRQADSPFAQSVHKQEWLKLNSVSLSFLHSTQISTREDSVRHLTGPVDKEVCGASGPVRRWRPGPQPGSRNPAGNVWLKRSSEREI